MLRLRGIAAVSAFFLVFASALAADEGGGIRWRPGGFSVVDEEAGYALSFGGRLQADYMFADEGAGLPATDNGGEFRRGRFFFSGTLYERFEFKAQYEFIGGARPADLYLAVRNSWGKVRYGHFKEYFALEELMSAKNLTFLERSLPVLAFSPSRNVGLGVEGRGSDRYSWSVGYFHDTDSDANRIDEDQTNLTGRVSFLPVYDKEANRLLHLGVGVHLREVVSSLRFRARPEAHLADRFVDTGNFPAEGVDLWNVEIASVAGPFWAAGEYFSAEVDSPALGDPSFGGFYVQTGYFLTGESRPFRGKPGIFHRVVPESIFGRDGGRGAWEIKARYSTLDLTDGAILGGEQDNFSVGLNWYPNPVIRLMLDYVHADVKDVDEANYVLLRWQVEF